MTNTYTLTGKTSGGSIDLQYTDGHLTMIKLAFKSHLSEDKFKLLISSIAQLEEHISQLEPLGFIISKQLPTNLKIDLFCQFYKTHKGVRYIVSSADSGKIKLIKVDEALLTHYFASDNFIFKDKHSVSNLVKYYNELRAEMIAPPKSKHPDHYSQKHMEKLDGKQTSDYYQHLRSKGFKPLKNGLGVVTEWVKA